MKGFNYCILYNAIKRNY